MAGAESCRSVSVALKSAHLLGALGGWAPWPRVCVQPRVRLTLLGGGVLCVGRRDKEPRSSHAVHVLGVREMVKVLVCEGRGVSPAGVAQRQPGNEAVPGSIPTRAPARVLDSMASEAVQEAARE